MSIASAALVGASLAMGGCFVGGLEGDSGPQTSKAVSLKGFDKVSANGSFDVTVTVGAEESINLEGSEERIKNFESRVVDGELILEEKSGGLFGTHGKLHVTITLPELKAYEINGSGDATITGVKGEAFALGINGSGDANVAGEAGTCSISVNGSGDVDATGLKSKAATVTVNGSGDVKVAASEALTVNVAGSGDVTYIGDPKVTKSVIGSGDVNKG